MKFKKAALSLLLTTAFVISATGCSSKETAETELDAETTAVEKEITTEEDLVAKEAEADEYYEAGRIALYGLDGTEINLTVAYENFVKAVELGNVDANFYLGVLYDWYNYPEKNFEVAKSYYEKCENNPYADISLGFLYWNGQGVEEDKEKAQEIFQTIIDQGCADGYLGNAIIAKSEQNYDAAYECYNKVLEEGTEQLYVTTAMVDVGLLYYSGYGVEQDYAKSLEWLSKAADLGNADAMNNIGHMYENGYGVEPDYEKALEWYEKAADLGHVEAMAEIGWIYYNGLGVAKDYAKAVEWLNKAIELGHHEGAINLREIIREEQGY